MWVGLGCLSNKIKGVKFPKNTFIKKIDYFICFIVIVSNYNSYYGEINHRRQ
jgi:hypothetical protein